MTAPMATKRDLALLGVAALLGVVALAWPLIGLPKWPPTPALLKGASAGNGSWNSMGCPPKPGDEHWVARESHAPLVEERLARQFPPGTSAARLSAALAKMGFRPLGACDEDLSIDRAVFQQTGGGILRPTIWALVAWKVDANGRVVWTKADVSYTGL